MRTVICDDHVVVRESLASLLEADGHEVVGCFGEVAPVIELVRRRQADTVVMDALIPGHDVAGAIAEMSRLGARVIAVSGDQDTQGWTRNAGAVGWLSKCCPASELLAMIAAVPHHPSAHVPVHPVVDPPPARDPNPTGRCRQLTRRERDVLVELAEGGATVDVAARLGLRESTVRSYVQSILVKLGVRSRIAAVSVAVREGLVVSAWANAAVE